MATPNSSSTKLDDRNEHDNHGSRDVRRTHRHGDETKPSWKTSELAIYVVVVIGILIASNAVGDGAANDGSDYFAADKAWWYITLVTIGYLVSRGLAKSGSRGNTHRDDD